MNKILICGTYFSGSSALTDLLSEYKSSARVPGEFDEFRRAGMIGDLIVNKTNIGYDSKLDQAIKNNLSSMYAHSNPEPINYLKYLFINTPLRYVSEKFIKKYKRICLLKAVNKEIRRCNNIDKKLEIASEWINDIAEVYAKKENFIIFDQPIFFNQHFKVWTEIFSPFKLIIICRDPRDQISDIILKNKLFFDIETPTRGLLEIYGADRYGAIRYEIDTSFARLNNAIKIQNYLGDSHVKIIKFEDLILNFKSIKNEVEEFIGIKSEAHIDKNKYFNPDISKKNIGIYKNILNNNELGSFEEILSLYYNI